MRILFALLLFASACKTAAVEPDKLQAQPVAGRQDMPAPPRLLAALEFKSKLSGVERAAIDTGYLTNAVRAAVLKSSSGVRVMTRENMLVLLQASGRSLEECEGECEVDTGRRLGAELVISGDLLRFGGSYKLDLRLHHTGNGELLAGAAASGETADKLEQAVPGAIQELLAPLRSVGSTASAREPLLGFPAKAQCLGHALDPKGTSFPTRGTFQARSRGADAASFHYEAVRTSGEPARNTVDGEWRIDASSGTVIASAVGDHGERFNGSSPGWQGDTLVELGNLQLPDRSFPYRSTWIKHGPRRLTFRFEILTQSKWLTTREEECSW